MSRVNSSRSVWLALAVITLAGCAARTPRVACTRVATDYWGPEDIELDTSTAAGPRLLVSVQERRHLKENTFVEPGFIVAVNLAGEQPGPAVKLMLTDERGAPRPASQPFHPHGISLVKIGGEQLLYVVNHAVGRGGHIEVFRVGEDRLALKQELRAPHDLLNRPNDLVALSNGDVYVTNLTQHESQFGGIVAELFGRGSGRVVRYHNGSWDIAADHIGLANGIAARSDNGRLYVAASSENGIRVYDIVSRSEPLASVDSAFLRTGKGLDNLSWQDQDKVLIAARHPNAAAFARHASRSTSASPSRILRVPLNGQSPTELYHDDGHELSAASVGIFWMNRLYIGQVFEKGVLGCPR
jgi:arylesterase/paraoxonase